MQRSYRTGTENMTNPLQRILSRQPVVSDLYSTRAFGTSKADAAQAAAAAGGAAYTTGGSAEAAQTQPPSPTSPRTQLP